MAKKICFFFGAGADSSLKIGSGASFAQAVLGLGEYNEILKAVDDYYSAKESLDKWYSKYNTFSYQNNRSEEWCSEKLLEAAVRRRLLEEYSSFKSKSSFEEVIKKEIESIKNNNEKLYTLLFDDKYKDYCSYFGIIDESFHTLICPTALGPIKFWHVVVSYTNAYLYICKQCDIISDSYSYIDALNNPYITYEKILNKYKTPDNPDNYYSVIKSHMQDSYRFITTNYTPIAESIIGIAEKDIAYIHGNMRLFENPRCLEVIDIRNDIIPADGKDIYFPFFSIQSGIKPIIDSHQIKEYSKMIEFLEECDEIVVVGYQLNPDDNHINGIIRNCLLKPSEKKLVYFDYNNNIDIDDNNDELFKKQLCNRLRIFGEKQNNVSIDIIHINEKNCIESFKTFMENI